MDRLLALWLLFLSMSCGDHMAVNNNNHGAKPQLNLSEGEVKTFATPALQTYSTCEQLEANLKDSARAQMLARIEKMRDEMPERSESSDDEQGGPATGAPMPGGGMPVPVIGSPQEGVDFSGTNNQEFGVDEADKVKTDGKFFYLLNGYRFEILRIGDDGQLLAHSFIDLDRPGDDMLLLDHRAYIFSHDWRSIKDDDESPTDAPRPIRTSSADVVRITVISLSDDNRSLTEENTYYVEGDYLGARKIGDKIHLANYSKISLRFDFYANVASDFFDKPEEERKRLWHELVDWVQRKNERIINNFDFLKALPSTLKEEGNLLVRNRLSHTDCHKTFAAITERSPGFVGLVTFTPHSDTPSLQWIRGAKPIVYASPNQIILASQEETPWWLFEDDKTNTNIHRFTLSHDNTPTYADSVRIPGKLHNSFSLSEYEGYIRVATTTGHSWSDSDPLNNHLFILGEESGKLDVISSLDNLAPGEKIWSARFSKDKGFLVTFKQVDPLFTLDLSDPKNPRVAGVLKVPGVSTYLQDIGEGSLLAIGYGGDEEGLDFQTSVSLFDVNNFSEPKLAQTLSFALSADQNSPWSRVDSVANITHLAINYFAPKGLTAIPITASRMVSSADTYPGRYEYITKLVVVDTRPGNALMVKGEVDHSAFYSSRNMSFYDSPSIERSYFVGDFIYALSQNAITATRLSDMQTTASYTFATSSDDDSDDIVPPFPVVPHPISMPPLPPVVGNLP